MRSSLILVMAFIASGSSAAAESPVFAGFSPRVAIPVQRNAHSVVADDMNEDGHADLIVATSGTDNIAVLAGQGDGTFARATYWPAGVKPKYAVTGDFDRDGHRDIVTADQDSAAISVLLGVGDGSFKPKVSYPACNGTHEVAVADFNRDGKDDVVAACHGKPYSASVFFGNGDGSFGPRLDITPGAEPAAVVVGEFNGDGVPDLAFANHAGDSVGILLSKGDGTFSDPVAYPTAPGPHGIRTADFDGDGHLDLVSVNDRSNSVSILPGRGDGTFGEHRELQANSEPKSVAAADLNGDGRADVVISNDTYPTCCTVEGSTISLFLNQGDMTFGARHDYYSGGNPFSLLVHDLNGDGKVDVATANFLDQTSLQHIYLTVAHAAGLSARRAKFAGLGGICLLGLGAAGLAWRRFRWTGLVCSLAVTAILAGWFVKFSKTRTVSESHVSLFFGK